ncbi:MAG: glycosyltransferase [Actinobacteria bacterium]|nr:MAG: glycosyltransferase [Actinomycetota bacterium]
MTAPAATTRPLRVSVVTPFGSTAGGAEAWLRNALDLGLTAEDGFVVSAVVLAAGPLVQQLRDRGIESAVVPVPAAPAGIAARVPAVARALRRQRPDVVVANGVKAQLVAAGSRAAVRAPLVYVKHDHSFDATLAKPLGAAASAVVATALEVGQPTGRSDLIVIEPPRPPEPLPRDAALAELAGRGLPADDRLTLMMITRLVPYKGVDVAIDALSLPGAAPWRLVVVGGDDAATPGETERLRALAERSGVSDRVVFLGPIPGAGTLVAAADALAVLTRPGGPRTPGREGYGITATEAMLAGVPVIVAGQGPIARRLQTPDGPAGVVLDAADPGECARALAELDDADLRADMGARGRAAAAQAPDDAAVARAFAEVVRHAALVRSRR